MAYNEHKKEVPPVMGRLSPRVEQTNRDALATSTSYGVSSYLRLSFNSAIRASTKVPMTKSTSYVTYCISITLLSESDRAALRHFPIAQAYKPVRNDIIQDKRAYGKPVHPVFSCTNVC